MNHQTGRIVGTAALAMGLVATMLMLILTAVHDTGTDGALYYSLQTRAGVLPAAGISDGDLRTLDGELARWLAGDPGQALMLPMESEPGAYSLLTMEVNGALQPVFNERETAHLEDCLALFALLRKVRRRLIPWAVLLITVGVTLLKDRRGIRRTAWLSALIPLIPLAAFAAWAAIDFDAAFTFFHRVLFTNDLWLLDPRTDLLIRICPESMFMAMGRSIALRALLIFVGVPAAATGLTLVWPKSKQKGEDPWNDNRATRRAAAPGPKTSGAGGRR